MSEPDDPQTSRVPSAPKLPDVESPPPDEVLEGVPSTEEVLEGAQSVDDVIAGQPSVDEILGNDR